MTKKASNRSFFLVSLLFVALLPSGCKKKEQPPPQPVSAAKPRPAVQKQATSAKTAGIQGPSLDFSTKKDPFKAYMVEQVQPQPKVKQPLPARMGDSLPIQRYEVSRFKVSGIIIGLKENTALIVDPEGKGYVVKEGMLIGSNDGRISKILPSEIQVIEAYRDDRGRIKKRTAVLVLPKK